VLRDGKPVYTIKSQSDALVTYKHGDEEVTVDNRGRPSFIEQVFGAALFGFGQKTK
jgi:hypothetical protein